ncbi:MAG: hypothetical protein JWQ54_2920 [Mucilaginibacter sp.]|nr:hypothetical protein [Mucilaginibacter sp.]
MVSLVHITKPVSNLCKAIWGPHSPGSNLDIKDQVRADAWQHDFDSLLTINAVPQFNTYVLVMTIPAGRKKVNTLPLLILIKKTMTVSHPKSSLK